MKISIVENNKIIDSINDEYILYNSNVLKDKLDIAINIVKKYILDNELLIVGGTAIDYALRIKNMQLYDLRYNIQDFDIISSKNIDHANSIGLILCSNGFNNISVIPAIHNTTVRVQYLGYTVFDSTYIPEYLYNKIPYLIYEGYKIIDPNYQKINQYLSVSFLFNITGPNYNIFNRFKKDIERFNLIDMFYSIGGDEKNSNKHNKINYKFIEFNIPKKIFNNIKITNDIKNNTDYSTIYSDICFHGELTYAILYNEFNNIINEFNDTLNVDKESFKLGISKYLNNITIKPEFEIIENKTKNISESYYTIKFQIPDNNIHSLSFINNNNKIEELYNEFKKNNNSSNYKKYIGELDIIPKHYLFSLNNKETNKETNIYIYDIYGEIPSVNNLNILDNLNLIITNYNYNLAYFLYKFYINTDVNISENTYLHYYNSLYSMVNIINELDNFILKNNLKYSDNFINKLKLFNYSITTLNDNNLSSNDYNFFKNFKYLVKNNTNLDILPPKNYMETPNCIIKKKYNYNSIYYNTNYIEIDNTNNADETNELIKNE